MMRLGMTKGGERIPVVNAMKALHEVVVDLGEISAIVDLRPLVAVEHQHEPDDKLEFMISKLGPSPE